MGGVPSKPGDPSRPLEVIGAGFSRTGTMSMQLALEELLRAPVSKKNSQTFLRCCPYSWKFTREWTHVVTNPAQYESC